MSYQVKNPNTNLETNPQQGTYVEAPNPPAGPVPVLFVPNTNQHAKQLNAMSIGKQADTTTVNPAGGTWPTVTINNTKMRNAPGDGSDYDKINSNATGSGN